MSETILIVDDEKEIADLVELYLRNENYHIEKAVDSETALDILEKKKIGLALLDVMLPDMDGFTLCKKIREKHLFPIIMLTAKNTDIDKIDGLTLGADDYITKPFETSELLARIIVQLRKAKSSRQPDVLTFENITLHTDTHKVSVGSEDVKLTRTEFAILKLLMQNYDKAVAKLTILDRISEDTPDCTERSLKQHNLKAERKPIEQY